MTVSILFQDIFFFWGGGVFSVLFVDFFQDVFKSFAGLFRYFVKTLSELFQDVVRTFSGHILESFRNLSEFSWDILRTLSEPFQGFLWTFQGLSQKFLRH